MDYTNDNDSIETETIDEPTEEVVVEEKKEVEKESDEARLARLKRQYQQQAKKMGLDTEEKSKLKDLDYGQKAYLVANGIKGAEEMSIVQDIMKSTGKDLDAVLESKYFQAELKELRSLKASEAAIPDGSKRSGQQTRDSVEYWIAKGELPPADQIELRRKVVNAKIASHSVKNVFSSNPIQGNY